MIYIFFFLNYIGFLYLSYLLIEDKTTIKSLFNYYYSKLEEYVLELSKPYLETFLKYSAYYYENDYLEEEEEEEKEEKETEKYENKYLKQFKELTNSFIFSKEEKLFEEDNYFMLVRNIVNNKEDKIKYLNNKLTNLRRILDKGEVDGNDDIKKIIKYHNLDIDNEDDDDEQETYNLNELFIKLIDKEIQYSNELKDIKEQEINDDCLKKEAYDLLVKKHLERLKNNYIMEYTPLGNIIMRYNEEKGSFEYFSNNTIPYRYLEPVGRKYVLTYNCKPLFVDLEEELKKAEEKKKEEKKEEKNMLVKLKGYNKNIINDMPIKNRNQNNIVLPPQVKVSLNELNNNDYLIKDKANRYTWEGRISNFNPLKKIDRKLVDKKYGLSYADFKRMRLTK